MAIPGMMKLLVVVSLFLLLFQFQRRPNDHQVRIVVRKIPMEVSNYDYDEAEPKPMSEPEPERESKPLWYVRDLVTLPPEDEFLAIIGTVGAGFDHGQFILNGSHCELQFEGGGRLLSSPAIGIDSVDGGRIGYVRCRLPAERFPAGEGGAAAVRSVRLHLATRQQERVVVAARPQERGRLQLLDGKRLVYEALAKGREVIVFTKGIASREAKETDFVGTKCVFFKEDPDLDPKLYVEQKHYVESKVLGLSQEVFRCRRPRGAGPDTRVSLKMDGEVVPSVAVFYDPLPRGNQQTVCACTMVRNAARFLSEWTAYHAHLGVEAFYLYDNNSDDETATEAEEAKALASVEVHRRPWPWAKTQESGFSHCAAAARVDCQWMAFVDVDEFLFPSSWLTHNQSVVGKESTPLMHLIDAVNVRQNRDKPVGQISFPCRNFGPSGRTTHPDDGVTQGYTCRARAPERHKSIVRLSAVSPSLANVIHHFELHRAFRTISIGTRDGVVNHYKYQAWDVFRSKFKRRVSAYVADWTERKNLKSRDRTPGLGVKDEKPAGWEDQFCEVQDVQLKNYIQRVFGSQLPWQR